jgi:hypothetical protein
MKRRTFFNDYFGFCGSKYCTFFSSCINDKKNDDKAIITAALDFELDEETIRSLEKLDSG